MPLTDTALRQAKPQAKMFKLYDERGLYVEVVPTGSKRWRFKYQFGGKEKTLSVGLYPDVPLALARQRRDEMRQLVAAGVDPSEHRRAQKAAAEGRAAHSFEVIAREWHARQDSTWDSEHSVRVVRRLEQHVFPKLGKRPVATIKATDVLDVLRKIEATGHVETAHRVSSICSQVFRYAVVTGRAERDVCGDLKGALTPVSIDHHPSITEPLKIGALLRAIDGYTGAAPVRAALRLAPLVFVRPGELRHAEWSEIDLSGGQWKIPGEKMKMGEPHIVPLSRQAVAILEELHEVTGRGLLVFPGSRSKERPISNNTLNAALRRLDYSSDEMTTHGFRSMASTLLHEKGYVSAHIERQLAHAERSKVRAAYNYAEYLPERRKMMQEWADYLDTLRKWEPATKSTTPSAAT